MSHTNVANVKRQVHQPRTGWANGSQSRMDKRTHGLGFKCEGS